jgi:endonuclease/exonuclease/phosphatase family metal-dependent hydrolase
MNDDSNDRRKIERARAGRSTVIVGAIALAVAAVAVAAAIFISGCGTSQPAAPSTPPPPAPAEPAPAAKPAPAMKLRVASLDVSRFNGRIEQAQIDELASIIADRKIEVLAVQGITRYPSVKTRIDLVDGLASAAGMKQVFGETINLSGRQSGNAVFSAYPVASSDSKGFEGVSGLNFEGALRVIVDAGTRPVIVVSTLLPDPLSAKDSKLCLDAISAMTTERGADPLLVLGNLPAPPADGTWREVSAGERGGRLWFTPGPIEAGAGSNAPCAFGKILITDIDIYPQGTR